MSSNGGALSTQLVFLSIATLVIALTLTGCILEISTSDRDVGHEDEVFGLDVNVSTDSTVDSTTEEISEADFYDPDLGQPDGYDSAIEVQPDTIVEDGLSAVDIDSQPVVVVRADVTEGVGFLQVTFEAEVHDGNPPFSYDWEVNDTVFVDCSTAHCEYGFGIGEHTVRCTVTDNDGDFDDDEIVIRVSEDLQPAVEGVSVTPTSGDVPLEVSVHCDAGGGNPPLSYELDFGDGYRTTGSADATHVYNWAGIFETRCTVTDVDGDTATGTSDPVSTTCDEDAFFTANYYNNTDFTDWALSRNDTLIDFRWGEQAPDPALDPDTFSVEWTRRICVPYPGEVVFHTHADDGVRLWIDEELIIEDWESHPPEWHSGAIELEAGPHDLRMQYFEDGVGAEVQLYWYNQRTLAPLLPAQYAAEFIWRPNKLSLLYPGEIISDTLLVQNRGVFAWQPGEVELGLDWTDTWTWENPRSDRWRIESTVAPEEYLQFDLELSATTNEGSPLPESRYRLDFAMRYEDIPLENSLNLTSHVVNYQAFDTLETLTAFFEGSLALEIDPDVAWSVEGSGEWAQGVYGQAIEILPGSSVRYQLDEHLQAPEGTVEFWLRIDDYDQEIYQFLQLGGYDQGQIKFSIDPNRFFRYEIGTEANGVADFVRFEPSQWTHVAGVFEDGFARLYVNGHPVGRDADCYLPGFFFDSLILGGSPADSQSIFIDDLVIHNRALTQEEVMAAFLGAQQFAISAGLQVGPLPRLAIGKRYPLHVNAFSDSLFQWVDVTALVSWEVTGDIDAVDIVGTDVAANSVGNVTLSASLDLGEEMLVSEPIAVQVAQRERALVLLDQELYDLLQSELERFEADVEAAISVDVIIDSRVGLATMAPAQVRELLRDAYLDQGIIGCLFVGHVPYEIWGGELAIYSFYYEDLDGVFDDTDGDDALDQLDPIGENVFEGGEIWSAWMYPNVPVSSDMVTQAAVLSDFFDKTHQYYTDSFGFEIEDRAIMYYDADHTFHWHNLDIQGLSPQDGSFYPLESVDHYGRDVDDEGRSVRTENHLRFLREPPPAIPIDFGRYSEIWNTEAFEICSIMTHANPGGQWFAGDEHFTSPEEVGAFTRGALIVVVQGCSFNVFNHNPAGAGVLAYPFGDSINQAVLTGGLYPTNFNRTHQELASGDYLGSAHLKCIQSVPQLGGRMEVLVGNPFVTVE